jgi:hypothetical protein
MSRRDSQALAEIVAWIAGSAATSLAFEGGAVR